MKNFGGCLQTKRPNTGYPCSFRLLNLPPCNPLPLFFFFTVCEMGCCFSEPVDFDGEVTLYHFDLHRAVGKGAFGKVCPPTSPFHRNLISHRCGSSSISAPKHFMPSNTSTKLVAFARRLLPTLFKNGDFSRRFVVYRPSVFSQNLMPLPPDRPPIHCQFTICFPR